MELWKMINQKHFKAVHKISGDEITFGIEDIQSISIDHNTELQINQGENVMYIRAGECWSPGKGNYRNVRLSDWLKDYELFYKHLGVWFSYNGGEE
jgi:hypothetical protein